MASYTKQFVKPYDDGWENLPSENTPITASILDDYDNTLETVETYLNENDIPTQLSDLTDDEDHRLVTDEDKTKWDGVEDKQDSTDEDLTTESKTIVGAINELDSDADNIMESLTHQTELGYLQRNIFNKYNVNEGTLTNGNVGLYIDATNKKIADLGQSYHIHRFVCIPCKPNKTYTVSLGISTVMRIATTSSLPSLNVATSDVISREKSTSSLTITTNASANYLCVQFFIASDGDVGSFSTLCDALMIEEGSVAHSYIAYGYGNTELTKQMESAKERGYLDDNLVTSLENKNPNLSTNANYTLSNAIPCKEGETYSERVFDSFVTSDMKGRLFYYDASGNYLNTYSGLLDLVSGGSATVPSGVSYLRFGSGSSGSFKEVVVHKSSTIPTKYVPSNTSLMESFSQLMPTSYGTSGLTYTNCTYNYGGYFQMGNVVVLNMRVTATSESFNISGLPAYNNKISVNSVPISIFDASSNSTTSQPTGMVESTGKITVVKATKNYIYFINAIYLCN